MRFEWHCLDCNTRGVCDVHTPDFLAATKSVAEGHLYARLIYYVRMKLHTEHENIGVKSHQDE